MNIQELKASIESNKWELESFYVFVEEPTHFLANQYINEIVKRHNRVVTLVEDIDLFSYITSSFDVDDASLYIFRADELDLTGVDTSNFSNLIIICNKVNKETKELFGNSIIEFPALETWQIKDFVYSIADGVTPIKLDWLINVCKGNVHRLALEVDKLCLFPVKERDATFDLFMNDGIYNDLTDAISFDLSNAVTNNNVQQVAVILEDLQNMDCEPMALYGLLLNSFRNVLKIQLASYPTAEKVGMNSKQFYAVSKSCGKFTKDQLLTIYDKLVQAEADLKGGRVTSAQLIDYMLINIFSA